MTRNHLTAPSSVEPDSRDKDASGLLADWWVQIDRWVNEGGADERVRPAAHDDNRGRAER